MRCRGRSSRQAKLPICMLYEESGNIHFIFYLLMFEYFKRRNGHESAEPRTDQKRKNMDCVWGGACFVNTVVFSCKFWRNSYLRGTDLGNYYYCRFIASVCFFIICDQKSLDAGRGNRRA